MHNLVVLESDEEDSLVDEAEPPRLPDLGGDDPDQFENGLDGFSDPEDEEDDIAEIFPEDMTHQGNEFVTEIMTRSPAVRDPCKLKTIYAYY